MRLGRDGGERWYYLFWGGCEYLYGALLFTEAFGYRREETTEPVLSGGVAMCPNGWALISPGLSKERVVEQIWVQGRDAGGSVTFSEK